MAVHMHKTGVDREIERRLADHSVRYTKGRRAVVAAISAADGPLATSELHLQVAPPVPLSSLYRSLAVLEAAGVVVPHYGTGGVTRYELAEWLTGHHHHLVCVHCGSVEDVEIPSEHEDQVRELIDKLSRSASFRAVNHSLEIEGECARCR